MNEKYPEFPKIHRLFRECTITEKIDGTNALVHISPEGVVRAGSQTRWLEQGQSDNYGFAKWVRNNKNELLALGPGHHYGEWYGQGIQRGYGLSERRFMLFKQPPSVPTCCEVATTLYSGGFDTTMVVRAVVQLKATGSCHVPGYMRPEGVVVCHNVSGKLFKVLCENDAIPKTKVSDAY